MRTPEGDAQCCRQECASRSSAVAMALSLQVGSVSAGESATKEGDTASLASRRSPPAPARSGSAARRATSSDRGVTRGDADCRGPTPRRDHCGRRTDVPRSIIRARLQTMQMAEPPVDPPCALGGSCRPARARPSTRRARSSGEDVGGRRFNRGRADVGDDGLEFAEKGRGGFGSPRWPAQTAPSSSG